MGDLIYSLLFCKLLNVDTIYVDGHNDDIKLNEENVKFLLPFMQDQSYMNNVELYNNQSFDLDYGIHPQQEPVVVGTNLTSYHASKFDILNHECIWEPWLDAPVLKNDIVKDKKVLINRTARYHGDHRFYTDFLKYFHPHTILFAGLEEEYEQFCYFFRDQIEFKKVEFLKTETCMELAAAINSVPTFVGNESLICAIATGLGKNCYIEYGRAAANYIFNRQNMVYF